ncbi:MAG: DUF1353 domain-containing protein, partial [Gemmatimonadales bacterium]
MGIQYRTGYKYQLAADYTVLLAFGPAENIKTEYICFVRSLQGRGYLTVKEGYAWDGPSGPTVDTKDFMRGSLVHDALYQL